MNELSFLFYITSRFTFQKIFFLRKKTIYLLPDIYHLASQKYEETSFVTCLKVKELGNNLMLTALFYLNAWFLHLLCLN